MAEPARWAGPKTRILGDVTASEDLLIEGQVEGKVSLPAHRLVVASTAKVKAEIFARDITIAGEATGTFTASERVELQAGAKVDGRIVSPRVALADGAVFNGTRGAAQGRGRGARGGVPHRARRRPAQAVVSFRGRMSGPVRPA